MRIRRAALPIIAIAMVAAGDPGIRPASAMTAAEVRQRVTSIRDSLKRVSADLGDAERGLAEADDAVARHTKALGEAEARSTALRTAMNRRIADLYMLTSSGEPVIPADPHELSRYIDRLTYLEEIRRGERGLFEEIRALRARATTERRLLRSASARARDLRNTLNERQSRLSTQLRELTRLQRFLESISPRRVIRSSRAGARGFLCPVVGPSVPLNNFGDPRPGGPHTGVDIRADYGQYVRAVLPATVVDTPYGSWIGVGIVIRDLAGNEWWYAHLSSESVKPGQRVTSGEVIGRVGCSGRCYGPHLHFEYHPGGGAPRNPYSIVTSAC